eukprot:s246_g14.t1
MGSPRMKRRPPQSSQLWQPAGSPCRTSLGAVGRHGAFGACPSPQARSPHRHRWRCSRPRKQPPRPVSETADREVEPTPGRGPCGASWKHRPTSTCAVRGCPAVEDLGS